ncbi:MAG: nitrate ABC transporter permease [Bacteroidota bacterium]
MDPIATPSVSVAHIPATNTGQKQPWWHSFARIFSPNVKLPRTTFHLMVLVQLLIFVLYWVNVDSPLLPKPLEIWHSFVQLTVRDNLFGELATSLTLVSWGMLYTVIISLLVSYLIVIPFFRPLAFIISKLRFLSLVGLSFFFTMMMQNGHGLKTSLLVFGMSVFFVTSMVSVILSIPTSEFAHARTLKMKEWEVVWEVIILGKIDQVFDVIRQNFAISWMMLTMVEKISEAEGGIGALLYNQHKYMHMDAVFAIQLVILFVGIGADYFFGWLRNFLCPYATLTLEKR